MKKKGKGKVGLSKKREKGGSARDKGRQVLNQRKVTLPNLWREAKAGVNITGAKGRKSKGVGTFQGIGCRVVVKLKGGWQGA